MSDIVRLHAGESIAGGKVNMETRGRQRFGHSAAMSDCQLDNECICDS